jgi:hypothetical protein
VRAHLRPRAAFGGPPEIPGRGPHSGAALRNVAAMRLPTAVAAALASVLLLAPAAANDYSQLLHGPQCKPFERGAEDQPYWAHRRRMSVLVDSVLLGGLPALREARPCWRVRGRGRPALMVRAAAAELRRERPRIARVAVIGLGYNSLWERRRRNFGRWARRFDREARTLLRALSRLGAKQFVWVTLREPTARTVPPSSRDELGQYSWYFPYVNERLRRLDRKRDDLVLADWAEVSRRPGLTYDTIHLNERGAKLMARTIRRALFREARRQAGAARGGGTR